LGCKNPGESPETRPTFIFGRKGFDEENCLMADSDCLNFTMLCQICQKRDANVHETIIHLGGDKPNAGRHLCEVCAGRKTEMQFEEEQKEAQKPSERRSKQRNEESRAMHQEVAKELWEPRFALMRRDQIRAKGTALDPHWKLVITGVDSLLPFVDPLNSLFEPGRTGANHVVQPLTNCEAHVIRWNPDPAQYAINLFEIFPQAGARLDVGRKLLFVEGERKLYGDPYKSLTFCNLAACLLCPGPGPGHRYRFLSSSI
jgi:hypothetical protein